MSGRPDLLERWLPPGIRFVWGLALLILVAFEGAWQALSLLAAVFAFLGLLSGKRINLPYFAFLTLSVAFFHLLTPFGPVWFQIGSFPVTWGALTEGLTKGLTLTDLVFVSLFTVHRNLRLPGSLGGLLARVFFYFERLLEMKKSIAPRAFVASSDRVLTELCPPEGPFPTDQPAETPPSALGWPGVVLMVVVTVLTAGLLFWKG